MLFRSNNDKEKLINVLENYSFECTDSNCTKIAKENYCELTGSIDFFKYEFTNKVYCSSDETTITTTYNWKNESLIQYFVMPGDNDMAILDEKGEFSCNAGTTESCYDMKTTMLQHKDIFQGFISEANIDIKNIK